MISRLILTLSLLAATTYTLAQKDAPDTGILYNTKESHSLVYRCTRLGDAGLECEFTQVMVRRKSSARDLEALLKRGREEFREFKVSADECRSYGQMLDIFEGRTKPPKEPPRRFTSMEIKDYTALAKSLLALCKSKTEENYLAFLRIGHDKDNRTCTVSSNSYKQRFRTIRDGTDSTPAWVVAQDGPEGPCGLVNLSRFEIDKETVSRYPFWTYTARKAVTNPQGTFFLGGSCKQLDEDSYFYDWKSAEHPLGCDYISFSPL